MDAHPVSHPTDQTLSSYGLGKLDDGSAEAVHKHLEKCPACRNLYDILQAHHSRDALPLNLARPEVPVELAVLVGKMMAKEPKRRFQEPKEVAQG